MSIPGTQKALTFCVDLAGLPGQQVQGASLQGVTLARAEGCAASQCGQVPASVSAVEKPPEPSTKAKHLQMEAEGHGWKMGGPAGHAGRSHRSGMAA